MSGRGGTRAGRGAQQRGASKRKLSISDIDTGNGKAAKKVRLDADADVKPNLDVLYKNFRFAIDGAHSSHSSLVTRAAITSDVGQSVGTADPEVEATKATAKSGADCRCPACSRPRVYRVFNMPSGETDRSKCRPVNDRRARGYRK